jgi:hypothetical protein
MQSLLIVFALPPLLFLAAMYNAWKFRSFDGRRYLVRYRATARAQQRS